MSTRDQYVPRAIRGNVYGGLGVGDILDVPRASVYRLANDPSIPNAASTPMVWDTLDYDTDGMWNSADPTKLTARTQGLYKITAWISFSGNVTGYRQLELWRNAAYSFGHMLVLPPTVSTQLNVTSDIVLNAGDYVTANATQTGGGALFLDVGTALLRYHGLQACLISTT